MTWKQLLSLLVSAMMTLSSFFQSGIGTPEEPFDPGTDPGTSVTEPAPIVEPEFPDDPDQTQAELAPCIFHIAPEEVWLLPGDSAELIVEAEPVLPNDGQTDELDSAEEPMVETVSESPEAASDPETGIPFAEEATGEKEPGTETAPDTDTGLTVGERFEETLAEEKHVSSTSESAAEEPTQTDLSVECDGEPTIIPASTGSQEDAADVPEAVNEEDDIPTEEGILDCSFDPDLLEWHSENEAIAAVDQTGLVTAVSLGETVISVYLPDRDATATCAVYVVEELPSSAAQKASLLPFGRVVIAVNPYQDTRETHYTLSLISGSKLDLNVYPCDAKGNPTSSRDVSSRVNWSSDNTGVATVDQYGRVAAVGEGTATITVKAKLFYFYRVYHTVNVTVVRYYGNPHNGITSKWCTQYHCTKKEDSSCKVADFSPGTELQIFGQSGGYYFASVKNQSKRYFMWKSNICDQTAVGSIRICKKGDTNDVVRHRVIKKGESLSLSLKGGGTCTWSTFANGTSVVTLNGAASSNGSSVTVHGVAEGQVYIIANQNDKMDAIHVTVITSYATPKSAATSKWCSQYQCIHSSCTISGRKIRDIQPGVALQIEGQSGGFYYAKVSGESKSYFMWKGNISVKTWTKQCSLQNRDVSGGAYAPQGFAVDDNYAYSFEVRTVGNQEQHRLFQYDILHQTLKQMTPVGTIGSLKHANDAAVVCFSENGAQQKYLFVTASYGKEVTTLVKLKINNGVGSYQEIARYKLDRAVAGISLYSGGGNQPAVFLLKSGSQFYEISLSNSQDSGSIQVPASNLKFSFSEEYVLGYDWAVVDQGMHYEPTTDRLYLPFFGGSNYKATSVIRCYYNISSQSGTISEKNTWSFTQPPYFEIEGIGFRTGSSDHRLWFNTYDDYENGGIYSDDMVLR